MAQKPLSWIRPDSYKIDLKFVLSSCRQCPQRRKDTSHWKLGIRCRCFIDATIK